MRRTAATLLAMTFVVSTAWAPNATASDTPHNGRFWLTCRFSHRSSDDPIAWPGQPGATHSHDFIGNATTDASSTYEGMVGQATTCALADDTAGYWVPTLMVDGTPVAIRVVNVYYWGFRGRTQAFPPDLEVIAGASAGIPSGTKAQSRKTGWMCVRDGALFAAPPDCGADFVRMVVTFPSCWNGVATNSADHHSHLAYPVAGSCPADHPVPVPRLVVHVEYGLHDGTHARLSSDLMAGAPAGSTIHADFWNTWDQATLERLVRTCIDTGPNRVFR
ncbi:MAG: DUF1996 domain-containing protein [Actinomycetota bacterium]